MDTRRWIDQCVERIRLFLRNGFVSEHGCPRDPCAEIASRPVMSRPQTETLAYQSETIPRSRISGKATESETSLKVYLIVSTEQFALVLIF